MDQVFPSKGIKKGAEIEAGGNGSWRKVKVTAVHSGNGARSTWEENGEKREYWDSYSVEPEPEEPHWFRFPSPSSSQTSSSSQEITGDTEISLGLMVKLFPQLKQKTLVLEEWVTILTKAYYTTLGSVWEIPEKDLGGIIQQVNVPPACVTRLRSLQNMVSPTPAPETQNDEISVLQAQMRNVEKVLQYQHQPSGKTSLSYAEVYKAHSKTDNVVSFTKSPLEVQKRVDCWTKMFEKVKEEKAEKGIQAEFLRMLQEMEFQNLEFYDTHTDNTICHPQKPDITGVVSELALHTKSAVVLLELRACHRAVDGKMRGQVISGVNRVWDIAHQEMYGFAVNGHEKETFVYHKLSETESKVGKHVSIENVIKLLEQWDAEIGSRMSSFKPKVDNFLVNYRLGSGKTSDVYCISKEENGEVFVLKVPKKGFEGTVEHEATVMEELDGVECFAKNDHLAQFAETVEVEIGEKGDSRMGLVSFPCGLDKKAGRLSLVSKDVIGLVEALTALHEAGYYHRDVSPSNVGHHGEKRTVFLRDYGFLITKKEAKSQIYQGSLVTASKNVLNCLKDPKSRPFAFTARDDFESLAKTILIAVNGNSPLIPEVCSTVVDKANAMSSYWDSQDEYLQPFVDSLMNGGFVPFCQILLPSGDLLDCPNR